MTSQVDRFDTAAQVTVADVEIPVLESDDARHLLRVLRLRDGSTVTAADGAGRWRTCRLAASGGLEPLAPVVEEPASHPRITVALAPVKGDRPELVVQKLTELGVDRIVLFHSARSVVRWRGERAERQVERLSRVARAACEQSRRLWMPEIGFEGLDAVPELAEVRRALEESVGGTRGIAAAERGAEPLVTCEPMPHTVLIGPEGGWEPGELDGLATVGLGSTVLRAETAAIASGALLIARRGVGTSPHGTRADFYSE